MRLRRSVTALSVLATLAAFTALPTPPAYADSTTDTYIVQLKAGVSADKVVSKLMGSSAKVIHKVFQGGIVKLNAAQAKALEGSPYVKSVHKDAVIHAADTQLKAPWDLDMLDSTTGTLDNSYTYPNNGSGVTVYVIDTGIYRAHPEFAGANIATGYDFINNDTDTSDCQGHGTAVSSLIAGSTLGASKGVTLVPLKVLKCDGSGSDSDVIRAAEWIAQNRTLGAPAVANLSLGGSADTPMDAALQGLINAGVTVVAAAGNGDNVNGWDACTQSPARLPDAITVAAVDKLHVEPKWTNYGSCVDLYAPGVDDSVAMIGSSNTGIGIGSGTSFSAPLTTGAAALVLHDHPTWTPAQVTADILDRAVDGVVTGPGGLAARSANKLLHVTGRFTGTAPTITGAVYAGDVAEAVLNWLPTPTSATYQWYRNGVAIDGATAATYETTSDDLDQSLTVTATTTQSGYTPISGTSDPFVPTLGLPMTKGTPTITGSPAVSYALTADPGVWDPPTVAFTYQWRRDGIAIPSATATTYAPVAADVGHTLTVYVTGRADGYVTGRGVESAPTAVIQNATSPLAYEAFVKASYEDFLGRPPTVDELASKTGALSSGTLTTGSYLSSLATSDEWLSAIVTKMYSDTLDREPDAAGLADWVSWLRSGRFTVAQVASLFYASDEYYAKAGGTPSLWVTSLYVKLLNRQPDAAGLQFWIGYTNNPAYGKSWVAYPFYQSVESRQLRVKSMYEMLLQREPDSTGWPFWTARVLTSGDIALAVDLANSPEYWQKALGRF